MKRFRLHLFTLIAIVIFGMSPLIPVGAAGLLAAGNGCHLSEAAAIPCLILGHDFGMLLYELGVLGWFGLITLPVSMFLLILWVGWLAVSHFSARTIAKR